MDANENQLHRAETLIVLYLVAPIFTFFAFFIRLEIAIPACVFIGFMVYELIRRTTWRESSSRRWEPFYLLFLAAFWVWLSGGIGPVPHQNDDWAKHYVVINFLTQHSWPATDQLPNFGTSALRYYLGWYLVPSLALKLTHTHLPTFAMSAWTMMGVFLFFNLLPSLVGRSWGVIVAPIVFILFGGMDVLGIRLSEFYYGWPYHFEWWAGWAQYSSNTTALFFVPQHAIPAWLGVAMLMRFRHRDGFLPYCALLVCAVLLWSPFSAIGLMPFLIALIMQHGFRKIVLHWRAIASGLLLALPIGLYLVAGSEAVPHGYVGTTPGMEGYPGFTWPSYLLFLLIEISMPLAALLLRREPERGFLAAAAIALCLIPLYRIGIANDFAMRASLPSLAVLAILCAKLFVTGPRPYPTAALVVILAGIPTVAGEITRGFLPRKEIRPDLVIGTAAVGENERWWLVQYFAPLPIWVLR